MLPSGYVVEPRPENDARLEAVGAEAEAVAPDSKLLMILAVEGIPAVDDDSPFEDVWPAGTVD